MKQNTHPSALPLDARSISTVLLTSVLWGGTPVAVSFAASSLPPVAIAAVRFTLGGIFMLFWCRRSKTPLKPLPGQLRVALVAGFLLFLQITTFNIAIDWSNSSHAAVLINTFVFWVLAIEHFLTKADRLTRRKVGGLVIASTGVVAMLLTDQSPEKAHLVDQPSLVGDSLMVVSAFLLAVRVIFVKQTVRNMEPGKLVFWHDVFGVLLFVTYSLLFEQVEVSGMTTSAVLGLAYQGILVAGLCFALHAQLLSKHSASQISVFSFLTPLFGILWAGIFRDDPLNASLFLSGGCIVIGIYLVSTRSRRASTPR